MYCQPDSVTYEHLCTSEKELVCYITESNTKDAIDTQKMNQLLGDPGKRRYLNPVEMKREFGTMLDSHDEETEHDVLSQFF